MKLLKALASLAVLLSTFGCTAELKIDDSSSKEASPITWTECSQETGDHPCNISLTDQEGEVWDLYENYGKTIVLDFSTEWCGYCQLSATTIQSLQDAYSEEGVIFVTVLVEDRYGNPASADLVTNWSNHFGISAPVLAGSRDLLSTDTSAGWPVVAYPSYFFIDEKMTVGSTQRGYGDDALRSALDSLLASYNTAEI